MTTAKPKFSIDEEVFSKKLELTGVIRETQQNIDNSWDYFIAFKSFNMWLPESDLSYVSSTDAV
jgi:hypothetical protein